MLPKYSFQSVVLAPADVTYNPCDDLIFPSVVKVEHLSEGALGRYHMYYAPHNAPGGICLAYADDLTGPWTEYNANPIVERVWAPHYDVSHISSPHVLWMEAERKFFLYFHGENTTTRLATSSDGIRFDYQGEVVSTAMYEAISEASYARVFPCALPSREAAYVLLFMGNRGGTRHIYAAWSRDGRRFEAQPQPLISPPPETGVTQVSAPWYLSFQGRNLVVFHGDKTETSDLRNLTSDLYVADVGPHFDDVRHLGLFFSRREVSESNARASDPCFVNDESGNWLFLSIGPRLKQSIALARAPQGDA